MLLTCSLTGGEPAIVKPKQTLPIQAKKDVAISTNDASDVTLAVTNDGPKALEKTDERPNRDAQGDAPCLLWRLDCCNDGEAEGTVRMQKSAPNKTCCIENQC